MSDETAVRYSLAVPEEWDSLVLFARRELNGNQDAESVTPENIHKMNLEVSRLDSERLEANRYYATGLYICELAKALYVPEKREAAIESAALGVLAAHQRETLSDARGLRVVDVSGNLITLPFFALTLRSADGIDRDIKLVADSLAVISGGRQAGTEQEALADSDRAKDLQPQKKELFIRQDVTSRHIGNAVVMATTQILGQVLEEHYGKTAKDDREEPEDIISAADHTQANKLLEPELLRKLKFKRAAIACARMRIDEFRDTNLKGEVIDYESPDKIAADASFLRTEPPVPRQRADGAYQTLHNARLGCPALYVQGLIGEMVQIVPEIFARAQEKIAESINAAEHSVEAQLANA